MDDRTGEQRKGYATSSLQEQKQAIMGKKYQPKVGNYCPCFIYEKTDRTRILEVFFVFKLIDSFIKHLFSTYCVPSPMLGVSKILWV